MDLSLVEPDAVAKYYVKSELSKRDSPSDLEHCVDALSRDELRLEVQRLSEERKNEIYERLYGSPIAWAFYDLPASSLHLPKINQRVNPFLEQKDWELFKFANLVRSLPEEEALIEFKDNGKAIPFQNLLVLNEDYRYRIIDGSHRAVILCLRGSTTFQCYVGHSRA